jgi:hypothetical protein
MWALSKGLGTRNVFFIGPMVYSPIQPKSQIFNIGHDYALWIKNFMVMMKNSKTSVLRFGPMAHGHNPAKVPKFKYKA